MPDVAVTDEERAYMARTATDSECAATRGMPAHVAHGWIIRARAHELAHRRGEARTERITDALIQLAEAMHDA